VFKLNGTAAAAAAAAITSSRGYMLLPQVHIAQVQHSHNITNSNINNRSRSNLTNNNITKGKSII
jgi:hypothetical protein